MIELVEARAEHVRELVLRLREDDCSELAAAGITSRQALWRSWKTSHLRTSAFVDGEIAAMWGCGGPLLGSDGRPWLLTAAACERVPVAFVKIGREEVRRMLEVHERLTGLVWARYRRAIRTLALWGFRLGPVATLNGAEFLEYTMER